MSADSIERYITDMQNFGSRFEYNENRFQIVDWLKNEFLNIGFTDVELDSFMCATSWNGDIPVLQINVIATLTGNERPDDIYLIGGHYDSFNQTGNPEDFAPGADDNASGTASALETARAMMKAGYEPEATIKFVCFAAEELMLFGFSGSEHLAERYKAEGKNIKLMINNDMISHNTQPLNESTVSLNYYPGYEFIRNTAAELTAQYTVINPAVGNSDQWSDSKPFYDHGFPAIYFEEREFSPYYHTSGDIISNYDMDYCLEVIKAASALLINFVETPEIVSNFAATDYGDGSTVLLTWDRYKETSVNYKIYSGTDINSLTLLSSTSNDSYLAAGLIESTTYYFGIRTIDEDGNESRMATVSCIPREVPVPPVNVMAFPKWHSVEIQWSPNSEYDLSGYNIFRSTEGINNEIKLNTEVLTNTIYTDSNVENGIFYNYRLTAVDNQGNEGEKTNNIRARAVSLDQGVLFVNESKDGDGSVGNPSLEQLDDFYSDLADNDIKIDNYNIVQSGGIDLSEIGAYGTVVWHIDSKTGANTFDYISYITDYMDFGGNIIFTGYRPSSAFYPSGSQIQQFEPGSVIFDYLKISSMEYSFLSRLNSALNNYGNYPLLEIDPEKTLQSYNYHIGTIESIAPNSQGNPIYLFGSGYDISTPQGNQQGKPIGVEYIGADYKSVILAVPLFYFKKEQAGQFLNYVLKERFGTPTDLNEYLDSKVSNFNLYQNYPNPFNPVTSIQFELSEYCKVRIKVFDILGREVSEMINEFKNPGYYKINFDGSDLPSGVYFYRLQAGDYSAVKKMILIK